ncbi:hypothetical protein BDW02DRAFT_132463 [Decorospora gaudefroyi]|uniref:Uncharacterized protein n=1 Tax=Decorospora gaudefroyi TaxID=184978 RepID=A0A6A5K502_9PLEO|nr:hypothetical protein BDW02DRAFT_132463 [Decorospora gaudefroyi]
MVSIDKRFRHAPDPRVVRYKMEWHGVDSWNPPCFRHRYLGIVPRLRTHGFQRPCSESGHHMRRSCCEVGLHRPTNTHLPISSPYHFCIYSLRRTWDFRSRCMADAPCMHATVPGTPYCWAFDNPPVKAWLHHVLKPTKVGFQAWLCDRIGKRHFIVHTTVLESSASATSTFFFCLLALHCQVASL